MAENAEQTTTKQVREQQTWLVTGSLVVLATVAAAFSLHYMADILIPFVVAIFVGSIIAPVMDILELRWKFTHTSSAFIALMVVILAMVCFTLVLLWAAQTVVTNSGTYAARFEKIGDSVIVKLESVFPDDDPQPKTPENRDQDEKDDAPGSDEVSDADDNTNPDSSDDAAQDDSVTPEQSDEAGAAPESEPSEDAAPDDAEVPATVPAVPTPTVASSHRSMRDFMRSLAPRFAGLAAGSMLNIMSGVTLTLIFVMFVLAGRNPHVIRKGVYAEIDSQIRSYIATKVALSLATGFFVWLILRTLQMPMALVFGTLAFLLNFIPSVGSIIATLLPLPFALAEVPGLFQPQIAVTMKQIAWLAAVLMLPGGVQMLIGNILEPKLMGEGLKLHPITILLALAIWGLLWGPVGMLLATPMTAIIRIVLMRFQITQPAGRVLAGELPDLDAAAAG